MDINDKTNLNNTQSEVKWVNLLTFTVYITLVMHLLPSRHMVLLKAQCQMGKILVLKLPIILTNKKFISHLQWGRKLSFTSSVTKVPWPPCVTSETTWAREDPLVHKECWQQIVWQISSQFLHKASVGKMLWINSLPMHLLNSQLGLLHRFFCLFHSII